MESFSVKLTVVKAKLLLGLTLLPLAWIPPVAAEHPLIQKESQVAIQHMNRIANTIEKFHASIKQSLLNVVNSELLTEYFSLKESLSNKYTESGTLVTTPAQDLLRSKVESKIIEEQNALPISEACLVDRYGQEHMRTTKKQVEHVSHFSDSENTSPFFDYSMELPKNQVHLSDPYVSPDSNEWVIAFTSPISIAQINIAFLHMETPLTIYQWILRNDHFNINLIDELRSEEVKDHGDHGRTFIIDQKGRILADNRNNVNYVSKRKSKETFLPAPMPFDNLSDYTPLLSSISNNPIFVSSVEQILLEKVGQKHIHINGQDYVIAYRLVPDKPWLIVNLNPLGRDFQ